MTATEQLRKLLDERGVEYDDKAIGTSRSTEWDKDENYEVRAVYVEYADGCVLQIYDCTPEQAIAATLGGTKLTAEQIRECVQHVYYEGYNDGFVHRGHGIEETNWQAIADELNTALGGECELVYGENDHGDDGWWCQTCGEWFAASFRHTGRNNIIEPSYCQHCGKAVKR